MSLRAAMRNTALFFAVLPFVGIMVLRLLDWLGLREMSGTNEEKWAMVNAGWLTWLISGVFWIGYAVHKYIYDDGMTRG